MLNLTLLNIRFLEKHKGAFEECRWLEVIEIPATITSIGDFVFCDCAALQTIIFKGTTAQWNAVTKGQRWDRSVPAKEVICTDGSVSID